MQLSRLPGAYAVARAEPSAAIPAGVLSGTGFLSISRTAEELSVVAAEDRISGMDRVETGWTVFKVHGPFAFDETGIVAALSKSLADADIGIFVISTYDTDYILVKQANAATAAAAWRADGHTVALA